MSAKRTGRFFGEAEKQALLNAIGECLRACIVAETRAPIGSPVYSAAGALRESIDALAEVLTGDRTYFHVKSCAGPR